jgi:hypothetical protein
LIVIRGARPTVLTLNNRSSALAKTLRMLRAFGL